MSMSVSFMSGMKLNKYILPPGESKLGQTAQYIPGLRAVNRYYLGICTMDLVGNVMEAGDTRVPGLLFPDVFDSALDDFNMERFAVPY